MSKVPVFQQVPHDACYRYNGDAAAAGQLCNAANGVFARRIKIAVQAYTKTNAPTLTATTWATGADLTTPIRATTIKLRADTPIFLDGNCYYNGAVSTSVRAIAHMVLWNSSAGLTTIQGMRVYQGDPTDANTQWKMESAEVFNIAAGGIVTKCITGTIHPSYRDDAKITDSDMNYVFMDADIVKAGTAPKVLFFALYVQQMTGIDDGSTVVPVVLPRDFIRADIGQNYIDKVLACNLAYNLTTPGTLCPVVQTSESSQYYGFSCNLYRTTRIYHCFMPNTTYDSTAEVRGSLWVPLKGQGVLCADGNWRYRVRLGWFNRSATAFNYSFTPIAFPSSSTTGSVLDTWTGSLAANTNTLIERTIDIVSATEITGGLGIAPRVQRTSGADSTNVYLYTSLYSVKILPYTV